MNPHDKPLTGRKCQAHDLITVREGVQCANCLALVIDSRIPKPGPGIPSRRRFETWEGCQTLAPGPPAMARKVIEAPES